MRKTVNEYLTLEVEVRKSDRHPEIIEAYAKLFDHNTNRLIRTIRGQYILETDTEESMWEEFVNCDLHDFIERYTILAKAYAVADNKDKYTIEVWLENDPQFNDSKWHGDDKK
jgi:hypothetical protein